MKVAIFDADLIGREKHRFPNLACEKISGYWKDNGSTVCLCTSFPTELEWLGWEKQYDETYISKVFTDTPVPPYITESEHIHMGGTGFYFDKAPDLPYEIEHHMPDYHLYDEWIEDVVGMARKEAESSGRHFNEAKYRVQFREYTDYSIGFITRGCFRKCPFCVNQKFDRVFPHSPLQEFYDPSRKKLCLLDDNFMGSPQWRSLLEEIIATGKSFKFKQGLDERLLTEEKAKMFFTANYDGDYTFAFDNIADYEVIHSKLKLLKKYASTKSIKFYVLVGFESVDGKDIENAFKRIELLMRYQCLPYIMRYQDKNYSPWKSSKYREMYITMARWANQPSFFKKKSFRQYCEANQALHKTDGTLCSSMRALVDYELEYPEVAAKYFDLRFDSFTRDY